MGPTLLGHVDLYMVDEHKCFHLHSMSLSTIFREVHSDVVICSSIITADAHSSLVFMCYHYYYYYYYH